MRKSHGNPAHGEIAPGQVNGDGDGADCRRPQPRRDGRRPCKPPFDPPPACSQKLIDYLLEDNALGPDCQITIPCADVASVKIPVLANDALCDTSMVIPEEFVGQLPIGPSWGVCRLD